jgi:hypothetical protein
MEWCGIGLEVLCVREFDRSVEIWAKLDCWGNMELGVELRWRVCVIIAA